MPKATVTRQPAVNGTQDVVVSYVEQIGEHESLLVKYETTVQADTELVVETGKFENDPLWAELLWNLVQQGWEDDTYIDEEDVPISVFELFGRDYFAGATENDPMVRLYPDLDETFPSLKEFEVITMWVNEDGFVNVGCYETREAYWDARVDHEAKEIVDAEH